MIIFSSPKGVAIALEVNKKTISFFPTDKAPKTDLVFLSRPQEVPADGVISWPGEYDIDGIAIRGIGHKEGGQVSYVLETDDVRLAFLSSPLLEWSDAELELLGNIDVLAIPTDDSKLVQKLIEDIDPRVLIPLETDGKAYAEVLKAVGAGEAVDEYKLKGGLPTEGRDVIVLKSKG